MAAAILTADRLRTLLHYDPATGYFTRLVSIAANAMAGTMPGTTHNGYVTIAVDGKRYRAHRLAWLYVHGEWPAHQIDHINGVRDDNRIANLRDVPSATNSENHREARSGSGSGLLGAYWCADKGCYKACIRVAGKLKFLKNCETADEAHAIYLEAKRKLHAGCTI